MTRLMIVIVCVAAVFSALVPNVSSAEPFWRGWVYQDQAPANPQLGDGWLPTSHQNLRYWNGTHWEPVGGKWYKVASYTDDWWPARVLDVEPGMPQALGFESWQAMADDIDSPDGVISEIGLHYKGNAGSEVSNWFESFPANGLAPAGYPLMPCKDEKWLYLSRGRTSDYGSNLMHLRLQGTNCVDGSVSGPQTPVLVPHIEFDSAHDITLSVYVKI